MVCMKKTAIKYILLCELCSLECAMLSGTRASPELRLFFRHHRHGEIGLLHVQRSIRSCAGNFSTVCRNEVHQSAIFDV